MSLIQVSPSPSQNFPKIWATLGYGPLLFLRQQKKERRIKRLGECVRVKSIPGHILSIFYNGKNLLEMFTILEVPEKKKLSIVLVCSRTWWNLADKFKAVYV